MWSRNWRAKNLRTGQCPASAQEKLNGFHGGTNTGRSCWIVAGTFCGGEKQGVFAKKYDSCKESDFYKKVQRENFNNFQITLTPSKLINGKSEDGNAT